MLKSECYKMRRNRIFWICALIVLVPVAWIIYKDTILTTPPDEISNWLQSVNAITSLFLSIASGFVITFLMQREYEDKTIINVLSAPTSRIVFLLSKLLIWMLWYLLLLGISMLIYMFGGKLVYSGRFGAEEILSLWKLVAKTRFLSFLASTPLLLVAVLQRRTFYPSIMCSLAFTGIELFSFMLPVKYASMIPWSAAMLCGYGLPGEYRITAIISIAVAALIGIVGGWIVFQRQNQ